MCSLCIPCLVHALPTLNLVSVVSGTAIPTRLYSFGECFNTARRVNYTIVCLRAHYHPFIVFMLAYTCIVKFTEAGLAWSALYL